MDRQADSKVVNENVCSSVYTIQQNKEVIDISTKEQKKLTYGY